jgi:putative FmdB family regulatory protein
MPTYEYECEKCGHRFERFQSIKAEPIRKCPECGKNAVRRLISGGGGLIFKGSGFYITDYRDASYSEKAKAESGAAKPADAAAGGTTPPANAGDAKAATPAPAESKSKTEPKPTKSEPKASSPTKSSSPKSERK